MRRRAVSIPALVLTTAVLSVGCSRAVEGTPMATPGQGGVHADAALLDTTCKEYVAMQGPQRREVIVAIGESGNRLVALGPDAWVDLAVALCTFVPGPTKVADVLKGAAR